MNWKSELVNDRESYRNVVKTQVRRILEESLNKPVSQVIIAQTYLPDGTLELLTNMKGLGNTDSKLKKQLMAQKHIKEWFDEGYSSEIFYDIFYKTMWEFPQYVVYRLNFTDKALEEMTELLYGYLLYQFRPEGLLDATTNKDSQFALRLFNKDQLELLFELFGFLEPETEVLNDIKITFNDELMIELDNRIAERITKVM